MPEVPIPNVVWQRLAAAAPVGEHPAAELFAALAEQRLMPGERESVLAHLAACMDCREIAALAAPTEVLQMQEAPAIATRRWTATTWLRWAAPAAAAAVLVTVGIVGTQSARHELAPKPVQQAVARPAPQVTESRETQPIVAAKQQPSRDKLETQNREAKRARAKKAEATNSTATSQLADASRMRAAAKPAAAPPPPAIFANDAPQTTPGRTDFNLRQATPSRTEKDVIPAAPAAAIGGVAGKSFAQPPVETVQNSVVAASAADLVQHPSPPQTTGLPGQQRQAQNVLLLPEPTLRRQGESKTLFGARALGKVAGESSYTGLASGLQSGGANIGFRRSASGVTAQLSQWRVEESTHQLQRLPWGTAEWLPVEVAPNTQLMSVASKAEDVWAGGSQTGGSGVLYHSSDGGLNWHQVVGPWSGAITFVAVSGSPVKMVMVKTSYGEWQSRDAGLNWAKIQ